MMVQKVIPFAYQKHKTLKLLTEILSQVNSGLMVYIYQERMVYTYTIYHILVVIWFCSHFKVHGNTYSS